MYGPNFSCLREKLRVGGSLPICMVLCQGDGFMARVCLSLCYPCQYAYFLNYLMCRNHSAGFWISLKKNCSLYSCIFSIPIGEGKFRSLLCQYLGNFLIMDLQYSLPWSTCCPCDNCQKILTVVHPSKEV